jgi:hypothetical protein
MFANLPRRSIAAQHRAHYCESKDENELVDWEVELSRQIREHFLLQNHCPSYKDADEYPHNWTCQDQNKCFVGVEEENSLLSETNWSQDTDFFGLLKNVSTHWRTQREEAQKHCYQDYDIEDAINNSFNLIFSRSVQRHKLNIVTCSSHCPLQIIHQTQLVIPAGTILHFKQQPLKWNII